MKVSTTLFALAVAAFAAAPGALRAAPTAWFKAPAAGQTISGNIHQSSACEVAGTNIRRVVFSIRAASGATAALNTETSAPWNCNIDTRKLPNGTYTLRAVAYDAANVSVTASRDVNISNGTAANTPAVSFVQPANGATVSSGPISCLVNATDADGIRQVDWYVDGRLTGTESQAPFDSCNISGLAAGTHVIRAVATDNRGATGEAQVTVSVSAAPPPPPPPPPSAACSIGASSAIAVSAGPTRVSGIAPLAVFFDASGSTAAATNRPFHELEYRWNFGDPAGGAEWGQGSAAGTSANSKNTATGPLAAHVFETAGSYNVCVTVTDGVNTADRAIAIAVTAPDSATEFSGRNTLCVDSRAAPVAGADGCPTGAAVLQSADFDAAINTTAGRGATHKRILFRRGSTFSSSTAAVIDANGPGLVGAYGASGAKPLVTGRSAKMAFGSTANLGFADWRVMDLDFDGQDQSSAGSNAFQTTGPFGQLTLLRVEARRVLNGVLLSKAFIDSINAGAAFTAPLGSQLAIVDSVIEDVNDYGFLGHVNRLAFMGNRLQARTYLGAPQSSSGHLMRLAYASGAVISHNRLAGASPGNSLTIRGVPNAGDRTIPADAWTEKVVVSDNVIMGGDSVWFFTIRRVNDGDDARFRNVLVERNSLVASATSVALLVTDAGELTVRNNLFNLTGAATPSALWLGKSSGTPAGVNTNAAIYNNTAYSGTTANASFRFLQVMENAAPPNLRVRNNLSYAPNLTGTHAAVSGAPGAGAVISNNTDGAAIRSGNFGFVYGDLSEASAWRATGPDVVDQGTNVPVWSDALLAPRSGIYDLGAVNPYP